VPTLHSWQHGDPNLHNFLVSDTHIWGLDFTRVGRVPIANDVAHFLAFYGALLSDRDRVKPGRAAPEPALRAVFRGYDLMDSRDVTVAALVPLKLLNYWQKSPARRSDMTGRQLFRFERYKAAVEALIAER